jgi:hypothetical protein
VPLDRRIGHLEEEVEIASAERGGKLMNDVYVFLRHARPSIAPYLIQVGSASA